MIKEQPSTLPYSDTKAEGAADFYFAINATFRFIRQRLSEDGLRRYWKEIGTNYFHPVSLLWKNGGLPAVARYWREFFEAEPGASVEVRESPQEVEIIVQTCPAIAHLRAGKREIEASYCQHCYFVSEAIAAKAGLSIRVEGGNGRCRQRFFVPSQSTKPQDLSLITSCA